MGSLRTLEEMTGLDIVAPLADHYEDVISIAGIKLSKSQYKMLKESECKLVALEFLVANWKSRNSWKPRTWKTLLRLLNLFDRDLQEQVANFIGT